ncbi:ricin-type beta-trefoil lectin domain protein [Actinoplanes sp. NPDC051470]|uniref:RICIN domain-containing protein n=1 Tax=unclassified Actinoplanes TaxID=2626549 RepID=UPI003447FCE4
MIALTGFFTIANSPASAASKPVQVLAWYHLQHIKTTKCLEGSISVGIRLGTCSATNSYQQFLFDDGTWDSLANSNGFCVEAAPSVGVRPGDCNGTDYQQWYYYPATGAVQHMRSRLCLEAATTVAPRLGECGINEYQQWWLYA